MRATVRAAQSEAGEAEFFKTRILPIFATRCQSCHNHALKLSGLNLESAAGMKAGGLHGPVVMAGDAQQSRLYRRVARLEKPFMPLEGEALPEAEVVLLKRWIEQGAVWPEGIVLGVEPTPAETSAARAEGAGALGQCKALQGESASNPVGALWQLPQR